MAMLSTDNGLTFTDFTNLNEICEEINVYWEMIVNFMNDEIRETVCGIVDECSNNVDFLCEYLRLSNEDLIIG